MVRAAVLPALELELELSMCGCNTGCSSLRCKCKKQLCALRCVFALTENDEETASAEESEDE